jgi:hypothetical protein
VTSAVAVKPPGSRSETLSLFDGEGDEPTLDDVLAGVWEGLAVRGTAACPICGGPIEASYGGRDDEGPRAGGRAGAPESARCTSCGSSLS